MASEEYDPAWPDKAMFCAILLILAGFVGATFELTRPLMEVDQDRMPVLFTDDIPYYTLTMCVLVVLFGFLSLRYQSALFAYLGAFFAILSVGMVGLVPILAFLAVAFMVKSHLEGEETRLDGVQLDASKWPDKAMATSLFIVVVASIALLQALLIFIDRFDPLLLKPTPLAGLFGLAVAAFGFWAARQVYRQRRPGAGWLALGLGLATFGFYLVGPLMAIAGMVLLALAHREDEFHERVAATPTPAAAPKRRRRRRATAA